MHHWSEQPKNHQEPGIRDVRTHLTHSLLRPVPVAVMPPYCVVLFYKYLAIPTETLGKLFTALSKFTNDNELKGRILLAEEGINGTIAGSELHVKQFVQYIETNEICNLSGIDLKYSHGDGEVPFVDIYIKITSELISTGDAKQLIQQHAYFDPNTFGGIGGTGIHLSPVDFHQALESDPNAVVLDIRNDFEYDIGHFEGALSMKSNTFSETWRQLDTITAKLDQPDNCGVDSSSGDTSPVPASKRNYYMYCTGGIRCEKASVYLKAKGFSNVFQLQGGIHRYLEAFPNSDKKFKGRNFVFDSRMIDKNSDDGAHESESVVDRVVLGRCLECDCPHDTYTEDQRCVVCRQPVLICPVCKLKRKHELNQRLRACESQDVDYHCKNHRYLKDLYFKNLSLFSTDVLLGQLDGLNALEKDETFAGKEHKNRRKTIRNQMKRIEEKIDEMAHEERMVLQGGSREVVTSDKVKSPDGGGGERVVVVGGLWGS